MLKFTIPLPPVTKKNHTNRTASGKTIQGKAYLQYEKDAVRLIPGWAKREINKRVNVKALYYTKIDYDELGRKATIDLNNLHSALHDVLVAAHVLADDNCRIIVSTDGSRVLHDKWNSRTEVEITEVE